MSFTCPKDRKRPVCLSVMNNEEVVGHEIQVVTRAEIICSLTNHVKELDFNGNGQPLNGFQ